jgi:hypothetical protein
MRRGLWSCLDVSGSVVLMFLCSLADAAGSDYVRRAGTFCYIV